MKIIKYIAVIILLFQAISCENLLQQEPQGEWTSEDNTGGSFASDVFSMYAKVRGFQVTTGNTPLAIHNFRSEDVEKGSSLTDGASWADEYDNFRYSPSMNGIGSYWTENYAIIHVANKVLSDIDDAETIDELSEGDLINKSEALFFRAFVYFNLVRAFGEVPLIDFKISDAAEANIPKASVEKIYELIDADLTLAAELPIPYTWGSQYPGRLTWSAVRSLHAKTHLQRGNWSQVRALTGDVINTGLYDLNTPFAKIFREDGENCSESVWELQCTYDASISDVNEVGSQYCSIQGVRGSGDWNLGWGWHTPTEQLATAFESGDPRKDETLLYFYKTGEDESLCPPNTPWGEKPIANADVANKYYNKKAYGDPALRASRNKDSRWVNVRMIRYADVLLMAAEAENELGDAASALTHLEAVRARARGSNISVLPRLTTTDQTQLRAAIKHERRIELAMEWDRFYDLVRWNDAVSILGSSGYQPKHQYLPLPQSEVDKSNGILIQNPNY
jgi:hypothetical protein